MYLLVGHFHCSRVWYYLTNHRLPMHQQVVTQMMKNSRWLNPVVSLPWFITFMRMKGWIKIWMMDIKEMVNIAVTVVCFRTSNPLMAIWLWTRGMLVFVAAGLHDSIARPETQGSGLGVVINIFVICKWMAIHISVFIAAPMLSLTRASWNELTILLALLVSRWTLWLSQLPC